MPRTRKTAPRRDEGLRELADRALDIIYRYRLLPEPGFEYVSASVTDITGYTPEEHYADPELGLKIVHPDDRPVLLEALRRAPDPSPVRLRWVRKDGRVISTEQRNVGVFDGGGELVAIEGIARYLDRPDEERAPRRLGGLELDLARHLVAVDGREVRLTPAEVRLLAFLAERPGRVVSRRELVGRLWESDHVGNERACEVHISNLRKKVEREPRHPERIVTVRGQGYRFVPV